MKVLLFGKTGLLGNALYTMLKNETHLIAPSHEDCDVTEHSAVEHLIHEVKPEFVINATGYTNVDRAEKEPEAAFRLNADAVSYLAEAASHHGSTLVHFSTDYVFDGKNRDGYREEAEPAPLSVYGASKVAGEKELLSRCETFYLIRTAWLYGEGGKNFVDTMIERAGKREALRVVFDQVGNPTYALDLAHAVLRLLKSKKYGIYHLVNEGCCSWYDFAQEIFHKLGIPQKLIPITSSELGRSAERPAYSVLRNTKWEKLRPWKDALSAYLQHKTLVL